MAGAHSVLVNPNPASSSAADYINAAALTDVLNRVQDGYGTIVAMRDSAESINKDVPIFTHTYDYATPRNSPARFLGAGIEGPWLFKAFTAARIPQPMWQAVSDHMLDRLAEALKALADPVLPNFFVVDTRNILSRARPDAEGSDADWLNEIHPNVSGNGKLARVLSEAMRL
jgi:hypothetical protein